MPAHPCPGCAQPTPTNPRYADQFCAGCLTCATDHAGRPLAFVNDRRMAIAYRIGAEDVWHPCAAALCLIRGNVALVIEARFGGIVAIPAPDPLPATLRPLADLTRG